MGRSAAGMAHQATSTAAPLAGRAARALREPGRASGSEALGAAWRACAVEPAGDPLSWPHSPHSRPVAEARFEAAAERYDQPALTQPLGGLGDVLLSPLARWDAVWYLSVADSGYEGADSPRTAFFPLYPLLSRAVGELGGGSQAAVLLASFAVSLAALFVALALLHRLTALELGRRAAGPAVLLLCAFPASLFLGAPYSESLFLAASIGAFYAARTGHWAWAGVPPAAAASAHPQRGHARAAGAGAALPLRAALGSPR